MSSAPLDALTPREKEILTLIAEGDSLAEIAQKLSRSLKTIESHRLSIGRKLKAGNRVELAKIAIAHGLVVLSVDDFGSTNAAASLAQQWITEINSAIEQAAGRELLERFCKAASQLPGIDIAAICTSEDGSCGRGPDIYQRVIMAISDNGRLAKPISYNAIQTPCEHVIEHGSLITPSNILRQFPNDPWLKQTEAQGYLGLLLNDARGDAVGGVGLISRSKMGHQDQLREVIDFFAPRLAGAIRVCVELEALRSENDRLHADLARSLIHMPEPMNVKEDGHLTRLFQNIHQRVHQLAGTAFLSEFVSAICQEFGLYASGICTLDQSPTGMTLQSVALCIDGAQQDTIRYEPRGTPCDSTLKDGFYHINGYGDNGFNDDPFIQNHNIKSYCGTRLPSPTGETAGVIWVIDQSAIDAPEPIRNILQYYAPRIGAELANFLQFEMLMQERERLEAQLAEQARQKTKTPA